ncbi:MAG: zinc carboxypeptidase, partial [Bacteroidota bacterium]
LVEMMELHQIEMYQPKKDLVYGGQNFRQNESIYIPVQQAQAGLVKAMFFEPTTFKDSLFYDISAWTMYHAFNLQHAKVEGGIAAQAKGNPVQSKDLNQAGSVSGKSDIGYYFAWSDYLAPAFLYQLQKAGLNTKVSLYPFTDPEGEQQMAGTIFVATQNQTLSPDALHARLENLTQRYPIQVQAATSGWNAPGPDLGSNDLVALKRPKVLLITGSGTRSYDVGEIWHLLDQRYQMEVSLIDVNQVGRSDLSRYNVIIMASGGYSSLNTESIRSWVQEGGTLICYQSAISWAISQKLTGARAKSRNNPAFPAYRPYAKVGQDRGAQVIGGAIFSAKLDLTHPLAFGYPSEDLALFRRGTLFLQNPNNIYAGPLRYGKDPMLTGYISEENLKTLSNSTSIVASGLGRGKVLCFADNTNFRAFWYGTNKLLANAIFFGAVLDRRTLE